MTTLAPTATPLLSVVLMTRNESKHIADCLNSLRDFEEIIVVDNGSTDNTCSLITSFANARLIVSEWKGYGATRQVGVDAASHDWILWLDADERMTPALASEIRESLIGAPQNTVLSLPRKNFFLGQHIRGCGWSPDRVSRVFNRQYGSFNNKIVHEGLDFKGGIHKKELSQALLHYSYTSLRQFFDKNSNYAQLAGQERLRTGRKVRSIELFVRPFWEFFRCYVLKRGFLDGRRGLVISYGSAIYVLSRDAYCLLGEGDKSNPA